MAGSKLGFWSGMPGRLKVRAVCFAVYFLIAAAIFSENPILGVGLLVLPGFWYLLKNWLIANLFGRTDLERSDTLSGHTVDHVLNRASKLTRSLVGLALITVAVIGLGWVSTEDLRLKAAEPTLSERAADAASSAVQATKETTGGWAVSVKDTTSGWISATKAWFGDDSDEAVAE